MNSIVSAQENQTTNFMYAKTPKSIYGSSNIEIPVSYAKYAATSSACENLLELSTVQDAINEGCAEFIYSYQDNNVTYVSIDKNCNGVGLIYSCNNQTVCTDTDNYL